MSITPPARRALILFLLLSKLSWLAGCATPARSGDPHAARQRIVGAAERLIGAPYLPGGESPNGVDCSGLTRYAYGQAGIRLPRTTFEQFQAGRPQSRVLPGDLLFFRIDAGGVSHVGIYAGNGQMIHASSGGGRVRKVDLNQRYWQQRLVGGMTFLGAGNSPAVGRWPASDGPNG